MRHPNALVTTSEALRRVFVYAFEPTHTRLQIARKSRHGPAPWTQHSIPIRLQHYQSRHASTSRMGGHMASVDNGEDARPHPDRPLRDEEIKAFKVYLVHPETKRLTDPVPIYDVLQSRACDDKGRPTQFLQQMAPMNIEAGRYHPICKMFDKKEVREAEAAKRKASKEKKIQKKQLELSWTMTDNDLSHRLSRLKEFLEKGCRVEMLFGIKRKGWAHKREPSGDDVRRIIERIKGAVREVEGASELKSMQGKEGGEAVFSFEGKAKK